VIGVKRVWLYIVGAVGFGLFMAGGRVFADGSTWTPLISSSTFTGITTDVGSAAAGIVGVCLIVCGIGILVHVLAR
jgi:hypothetical protein